MNGYGWFAAALCLVGIVAIACLWREARRTIAQHGDSFENSDDWGAQ